MSKAVRLVCAAFCAASATAGVVSCVCRPWYTIATTEMEQQYSMFSICLNTTCRNYGFDFPNSSHSASSVNDRFVIFWIAALLGIVLDLTGALLCLCDPRGQKLLRVAVLLAGFLLLSASTAIFGAVMQNWGIQWSQVLRLATRRSMQKHIRLGVLLHGGSGSSCMCGLRFQYRCVLLDWRSSRANNGSTNGNTRTRRPTANDCGSHSRP